MLKKITLLAVMGFCKTHRSLIVCSYFDILKQWDIFSWGCYNMTIIKKFFLAIFLFSSFFCLEASSSSIDEIQKKYKVPLLLVDPLRFEQSQNNYEATVSLFSCFDSSLPYLIKQLRKDVQTVYLSMKKEEAGLRGLYSQLQELCAYLKKHKAIYNAVLVHNNIKKLYQPLFDKIDKSEDVIDYIGKNRELFGLQKVDDNYLGVFLKKIKVESRQIGKIEDYVHSDYIDLKMQNYIFKVEFIKLRNVILFDKRYKS